MGRVSNGNKMIKIGIKDTYNVYRVFPETINFSKLLLIVLLTKININIIRIYFQLSIMLSYYFNIYPYILFHPWIHLIVFLYIWILLKAFTISIKLFHDVKFIGKFCFSEKLVHTYSFNRAKISIHTISTLFEKVFYSISVIFRSVLHEFHLFHVTKKKSFLEQTYKYNIIYST